jgi:hypothetical protein
MFKGTIKFDDKKYVCHSTLMIKMLKQIFFEEKFIGANSVKTCQNTITFNIQAKFFIIDGKFVEK